MVGAVGFLLYIITLANYHAIRPETIAKTKNTRQLVSLKLTGYFMNTTLNTWNWGELALRRVIGDCKWSNGLCIGCKADWAVCNVFGAKLYVG